jgi:hypothetical protein
MIHYHNTIENTNQIRIYDSTSFWDGDYPSGGNHSTGHSMIENYKGPNQDQLGSDGIFDTAYSIDENNRDRYAVTTQYSTASDVNKDGKVNVVDIAIVARAFASSAGQALWDPSCDFDHNGIINMIDISVVAKDFGKTV